MRISYKSLKIKSFLQADFCKILNYLQAFALAILMAWPAFSAERFHLDPCTLALLMKPAIEANDLFYWSRNSRGGKYTPIHNKKGEVNGDYLIVFHGNEPGNVREVEIDRTAITAAEWQTKQLKIDGQIFRIFNAGLRPVWQDLVDFEYAILDHVANQPENQNLQITSIGERRKTHEFRRRWLRAAFERVYEVYEQHKVKSESQQALLAEEGLIVLKGFDMLGHKSRDVFIVAREGTSDIAKIDSQQAKENIIYTVQVDYGSVPIQNIDGYYDYTNLYWETVARDFPLLGRLELTVNSDELKKQLDNSFSNKKVVEFSRFVKGRSDLSGQDLNLLRRQMLVNIFDHLIKQDIDIVLMSIEESMFEYFNQDFELKLWGEHSTSTELKEIIAYIDLKDLKFRKRLEERRREISPEDAQTISFDSGP